MANYQNYTPEELWRSYKKGHIDQDEYIKISLLRIRDNINKSNK